MPESNGQSFLEFRRELIRRFFNPRSYFFLCLSTQLQDVGSLAADISEEDYLLTGQVMQHLVDCESPDSRLADFKILGRFQDFHHTLDESLHHLYQPGLAPDEMKQIIEGLTHDFIEVLIDIIHDPVEKKRLIGMLKQPQQATVEADTLMELNESVVEDWQEAQEAPSVESPVEPLELLEEVEKQETPPDAFDEAPEPEVAPRQDAAEKSVPPDEDVSLESLIPDDMSLGAPPAEELRLEEEIDHSEAADTGEDLFGLEPSSQDAIEMDDRQSLEALDAAPNGTRASPEREEPPAVSEPPPVAFSRPPFFAKREPEPAAAADEPPVEEFSGKKEFEKKADGEGAAEKPPPAQPAPAAESAMQLPAAAEPEGLVERFRAEADGFLAQLQKLTGELQHGRFQRKNLSRTKGVLLELRESAMIHGFEALEELARKGQRLCERLLREAAPLTPGLVRLLQEMPARFQATLALEETGDDAEIAAFAEAINRATLLPFGFEYEEAAAAPETQVDLRRIEAVQEAPAAAASSEAAPEDAPQAESGSRGEKAEMELELPAPQADDKTGADSLESVPEESSGSEIEPFAFAPGEEESEWEAAAAAPAAGEADDLKLPGEDDPELLQLIREVAEQPGAGAKSAQKKTDVGSEPDVESALRALSNFPEGIEQPSADPLVQSFRQEARLYFRVAAEALSQLHSGADSRLAWENLELACYSLKGLAQKLGLDFLMRLPERVEQIARKMLQNPISPEPELVELIARGLTFVGSVADKKDMEDHGFQQTERRLAQVLRRLQSEEHGEATTPGPTPEAAPPEEEPPALAPRGAKMKLHHPPAGGRKSEPAHPPARDVDNLDFLMNDDSDLLGLDE